MKELKYSVQKQNNNNSKTNKRRLIPEKIVLSPKKLFLIDSLGAFLTAFLISTVLIKFEYAFGMPEKALYLLSIVAFIYAIYSLCCYLFINRNWRPYLKVIAIANLIYCCITLGCIIFFFPSLKILGLIYFLGELMVIGGLILIELKTVSDSAIEKF